MLLYTPACDIPRPGRNDVVPILSPVAYLIQDFNPSFAELSFNFNDRLAKLGLNPFVNLAAVFFMRNHTFLLWICQPSRFVWYINHIKAYFYSLQVTTSGYSVTGTTITANATFLSLYQVRCDFDNPDDKSYVVSISNDGTTPSNEVPFIVFNSDCAQCNLTTRSCQDTVS